GNFDVAPVSLVDDSGDLVIGDRLHIAPSRVGDFDQINSPLALSAGLANELVARIAQDAGRIGRSAFEGRVRIGIKNAAVIAEGPARDNHARALEQPTASRKVTSVNHLPPGTTMLVTPARSTCPIACAAQRVQNSAVEVYFMPGNAPW